MSNNERIINDAVKHFAHVFGGTSLIDYWINLYNCVDECNLTYEVIVQTYLKVKDGDTPEQQLKALYDQAFDWDI